MKVQVSSLTFQGATYSITSVNEQMLTPMEVARLFEKRSRQSKRLRQLKSKVDEQVALLEGRVLELIVEEKLPESFKGLLGCSVYTREEIWASAKDKDHARLTSALRAAGLVEFLPSTVNSQSISGYVREHYNKETGEFEGLPEELMAALKITKTTRVIAAG